MKFIKKMINLRRKNDTLDARINRMMEFYELDELYNFKDEVIYNKGDFGKAMEFLDMQTRIDYWVSQGNIEPNIFKYMMKYRCWNAK